MKLWLASIDPDQASASFALGLFHGVLTNPRLLVSAKRPPKEVIGTLCATVPGPVFHQLRDAPVLIPSLNSTAEMHHFARAGTTHGFLWQHDVPRFVDHELVRSGVADFARDLAEIDRLAPAPAN